MDRDLLTAKLNQLLHVLHETEAWLDVTAQIFGQDTRLVRACQRNLQLLVEYAADINALLVLEFGTKAPGSYRESFEAVFGMGSLSSLSPADHAALLASVEWRNELIHEYEPAESHDTFFEKLNEFITAYEHYGNAIHRAFAGNATAENA